MNEDRTNTKYTVKIYHGYGHTNDLFVFGHVLAGKPVSGSRKQENVLANILHMIGLFFIQPVPAVPVRLQWGNQQFYTTTEADGFFKFEWQSMTSVEAGWHAVQVDALNEQGYITAQGHGKIFVPHVTQYAFISDIDDTVLISHSSTTGKKLRVMFTKNPHSRKTFADVVKFYHLLAQAHTEPNVPNPFFYVSSSEWNLYDDLHEFFKYNELPDGAFLLNQIKKWYQLLKTGQTKHEGKLIRTIRILTAFPKQRFILLGDNTQRDPEIYASIANKYPDKIMAIYIRDIKNISKEKVERTKILMNSIKNKEIFTCIFKHTDEAIAHARSIGLIV